MKQATVTPWMNLRHIRLSQTQKSTRCIMPLTWNSNESQGIKSKSAVAKMEQELTLMGQEETFGTDENVLYLGCGDHVRGCVELCIYNEAIVLFTYTLVIFLMESWQEF